MKGPDPDPRRGRRGTGHRPVPRVAGWSPLQVATLDVPAGLPDEMQPTWDLVASELEKRTTTAATDVLLIEAVVRQIHRLRAIGAILDAGGVAVESHRGEQRPSPFLKAERDAAIALLRLAEPLGLTVGARLRMGLQQLSGVSLADALMRSLEDD